MPAATRCPPPRTGLLARALTRLHWPLPALLAWACAWALFVLLGRTSVPPAAAWLAASLAPVLLAWPVAGLWRRSLVVAGFPLSALVLGAASLPAWAWLAPLALLLALYPVQAWRDAPLFPTALDALDGIAPLLALPAAPRLLDAGCGLGHGLQALHRSWPHARVEGLERSRVLAVAARLRCPWARVTGADMWAASWAGVDLVYLFQRPESMARAWSKAQQEMAPGSWLVSLEFPVPGLAPQASSERPGSRPVWAYRVGAPGNAAQPRASKADMHSRAARRRAAEST